MNLTELPFYLVTAQRKVVKLYISTSLFCQQKRNALAAVRAFPGNDYVLSFFRKCEKSHVEIFVAKWQIYRRIFSILFTSVTDEVNNCLEKFVSALYGYKNETSVNNVRVKLLQMKGIRDLALLSLCKDKPKVPYFGSKLCPDKIAHMSSWYNILQIETRRHSSMERWLFPRKYHWCSGNYCDEKDDDCVSRYKFTDDEISDTSNSER